MNKYNNQLIKQSSNKLNQEISINSLVDQIKENPQKKYLYWQLVEFVSRNKFDISKNDVNELKQLENYVPNSELGARLNYAIYNAETRKKNHLELPKYKCKIISLGSNCMSRTVPTRWGLKFPKSMGELTHPFDLSIHPYRTVCQLIENDFQDYLNPVFLKKNQNNFPVNEKYKVIFNHEKNNYFTQNNFEKLINTYERRIKNFYNDIIDHPILFLYINPPRRNVTPLKLADIIQNRFADIHHKLIYISTEKLTFEPDNTKLPNNLIAHYIPYPNEDYIWYNPHHYALGTGKKFELSIINSLKQAIINYFPKVEISQCQEGKINSSLQKKYTKQFVNLDSKNSFSIYKKLGDNLVQENKFAIAIASYQKALELDLENFTIYRSLGYCYHHTNNYSQAIINYKKAIELEINQPFWAYLNLANLLVNQNQFNEAIPNYQKAITIEPKKSSLHVILGGLYFQQGSLDKAFDCYLKAVQLEPGNKTSYGKLGYFHNGHTSLSSNQLDRAIYCYQQAIDKQPSWFLPYVYLGDSLTAKNELNQAIDYYYKAGEQKLLAKYPELAKSEYELDKVEQPDFIIIGAGKSGTSSLYEYICNHVQVISSLKKELRFFNKQNLKKGRDWYLSHFPPIPREQPIITGEADPGYFGWDVQEPIYSLFPKVKLIAILRNPVARAFSQYNHWVRDGRDHRSFQEAVTSELEKLEKVFNSIDVVEFENIEKMQEICYQVRKGNSKGKPGYLWEGLYVYFLQKWTRYFPKEQLLVLKSEDFYNRPEVEMKKVFTFLNLPDYHLPQYKKYNSGKYSAIDQQLYCRLSEFFRPHNQRLEEYLNRKLNWNETI